MEVDFDKQIDTILRDLAKGNSFAETVQNVHLDADEISAFAENALPAKARLRVTEHLADCPKCRKILTTFASLNVEAESETIHEEVKTVATTPVIPWYRRIFAFPQLAYSMGALALLLTGAIGVLVFQNSEQASKSDIAMEKAPAERPIGAGGASSEGEGQAKDTYSANTAANAANTAPSAANTSANTNVPSSTIETSTDKLGEPQATPAPVTKAPATESQPAGKSGDAPTDDLKAGEKPEAKKEDVAGKRENDTSSSEVAKEKQNEVTDNNVARQQVQDVPVQNRNQTMMPDGVVGRNAPVPASPRKSEPRRDEEEKTRGGEASEDRAKKKMAETNKNVGGKTFRNQNGVWIDISYTGGSTTTVKRGTDEYKKLDSRLQNIGNSLSGTVIVVWERKNYKIQ